ncbi:sporadic carbohydrate cluster 2OG-Fe(II) oxygenase [Paramagnetospirillum magneticum]|uniref:Sporadic carbohydrate cluster 2OG-Fe(II) oxygenase n=1 Tax=Paramagnetospirillum magneticum (strain ATCC 700264 / AMB-1) TaxID=342108 RepID=Q2WBA3_PARM1|nr:sporadic carbohydrate cluster 2OG-Fe(II) oxygenase [Paramagnetospirillum magneticum]BAE48872.1 hypothetical protein amb0068 [Paramagnetospirillum magneticum AMB-1]
MSRQRAEFATQADLALGERFLAEGHVVLPVEDSAALDRLRVRVAQLAAAHLGQPEPADITVFLETTHHHVDAQGLNALRLAVIDGINAEPWARPGYFATARRAIESLVGNELAMQLRLNLSIQLPGDSSSLLPVHADVWNGDSPYEVVLWLPLVNCRGSMSMFLLPPEADARHASRMAEHPSAEDLFRAIEPDLKWLKMEYGQALLFSQNLMHGNRVNTEPATRWSFNCRFKGLFTPYADKRLGDFFEPITMRPATRLGAAYRLPGVDG